MLCKSKTNRRRPYRVEIIYTPFRHSHTPFDREHGISQTYQGATPIYSAKKRPSFTPSVNYFTDRFLLLRHGDTTSEVGNFYNAPGNPITILHEQLKTTYLPEL